MNGRTASTGYASIPWDLKFMESDLGQAINCTKMEDYFNHEQPELKAYLAEQINHWLDFHRSKLEWMDAKTAPKNGTRILGYNSMLAIGARSRGAEQSVQVVRWTGDNGQAPSWTEGHETWRVTNGFTWHITHWMPISSLF